MYFCKIVYDSAFWFCFAFHVFVYRLALLDEVQSFNTIKYQTLPLFDFDRGWAWKRKCLLCFGIIQGCCSLIEVNTHTPKALLVVLHFNWNKIGRSFLSLALFPTSRKWPFSAPLNPSCSLSLAADVLGLNHDITTSPNYYQTSLPFLPSPLPLPFPACLASNAAYAIDPSTF